MGRPRHAREEKAMINIVLSGSELHLLILVAALILAKFR